MECQPRTYAIGIYKPYLGSDLRDLCVKEGFFNPDSYHDENFPVNTSVLKQPQITAEEIEGLYKTFFLYTKLPKEKFPLLKLAGKPAR